MTRLCAAARTRAMEWVHANVTMGKLAALQTTVRAAFALMAFVAIRHVVKRVSPAIC